MFLFKGTRTIKFKEGEKNVRVVAYTNSPKEILQEVLTPFGVVIVTYTENSQPLGSLYEVKVQGKENSVDIIFPLVNEKGTIRDAFNEFMEMFGILEIEYIKPYGKDIDHIKLKKILSILKKEYEEKLLERKGKGKSSEDGDGSKIIDEGDEKKLQELKEEITHFIKEMKDLLSHTQEILPVPSKELEDTLNDLLKLRNTTNVYKLAELYKVALEKGYKLNEKYLDYLKNKEKQEQSTELISELDIVSEYSNWEKAQRAKQLEKVDAKEFSFPWYETLYYKIFGKFGVNLKLIILEFTKKYKLNYYKFEDVLLFLQFLAIFLVIDYFLLFLYKYFALSEKIDDLLSIFYIILNISIFGIIFTIAKFCARKSVVLSILSMIFLFVMFTFLKSYFAL